MADPIVVVGAGLSGIVAARSLRAAGRSVVLLDKGRVPGGRLATRRVAGGTLDHGAQFFTVRSDAFRTMVDDLLAAGVVREWCRGFAEIDGYPRYAAVGGMNALARSLAADLDVRCGVTARAVGRHGYGWRIDAGDLVVDAPAAVVTPPLPQALALLDAGGTSYDPALAAVPFHKVLALLVTLDGDPAVGEPGARQLTEGLFSFVADNARKGVSAAPALTLHVAHGPSADRWDDPDDEVAADLLAAAAPWIGDARVVASELKRWRYAGPVTPLAAHAATVADGLVLAGDAFAGAKVEGAVLSGLAAAAALLGA